MQRRRAALFPTRKKITAYHEVGHAILFHVLPGCGTTTPYPLSLPVWGAPVTPCLCRKKDEMSPTKSRMLQDTGIFFWRRIAEEIIFGDITTGASSDIKKAN